MPLFKKQRAGSKYVRPAGAQSEFKAEAPLRPGDKFLFRGPTLRQNESLIPASPIPFQPRKNAFKLDPCTPPTKMPKAVSNELAARARGDKKKLSELKKEWKQLRACHVEMIFLPKDVAAKLGTKPGPNLRFCSVKHHEGNLVPIKSPEESVRLSKEFCGCTGGSKDPKKLGTCARDVALQHGSSALGGLRRRRRRSRR